jgi:hypothetical protein
MTDDTTPEPGWYWIRSSDSDAEFPIRLREDGYWLLRGRPDSPCLPPSWSIVARIDDLLRAAARYRPIIDAAVEWCIAAKAVPSDSERGTKTGLACNQAYTEAQFRLANLIGAEIAREKGS